MSYALNPGLVFDKKNSTFTIKVALRDGVLLLRGVEDGHRSKGIGPGTYDGETLDH